MTTSTYDRDWIFPKAVSGLIKTLGLVLVLVALGVVCSTKLRDLAVADAALDRDFVSASDRTRQLACMVKNIYWEAANEPFEGKVAVAQVVLNRMESGRFADTVCGVVYQKNIIYERVICQFSWFCMETHKTRAVYEPLWLESEEVAKKVLLENFRLPGLKDALFYHADYITNPVWAKESNKLLKIGRHIFYSKI